MKKIIKLTAILLSITMLLLLFVGCKSKNEVKNGNDVGLPINEKPNEDKQGLETATNAENTPNGTNANEDEAISEIRDEPSTLPKNKFTALMPKIRIPIKGVVDNEFGTTVIYAAITSADFNSLCKNAKKCGFDIDVLVVDLMFSASNEDSMHIKIEVTREATKITVYNDVKHFS